MLKELKGGLVATNCGRKHGGFIKVEGNNVTVAEDEAQVTRSTMTLGGALLVFRPPFRLAVDGLLPFLPTPLLLSDVTNDVTTFFRVLSLLPRFIPFSAFYPFLRVLSPFLRFIPFSAFYHFFRVLSLFPRFIPFSAFYPFFRVLSPFPLPEFRNCGSAFYPNPARAFTITNGQQLSSHSECRICNRQWSGVY